MIISAAYFLFEYLNIIKTSKWPAKSTDKSLLEKLWRSVTLLNNSALHALSNSYVSWDNSDRAIFSSESQFLVSTRHKITFSKKM